MQLLQSVKISGKLIGVMLGLFTAFCWSLYNVGSKIGHLDGLRSIDLVMVRFAVGGLILLPVLLLVRPKSRASIWRVLFLTLVSGPIFAFLISQGFRYAPLSHGIVLAPCISMLATSGFAWILDKQRPNFHRSVGMIVMIVGILLIGLDASRDQPTNINLTSTFWGDLWFICGSTMWGAYTYLVGRWQLEPLAIASSIGLLSALVTLPIYFSLADLPQVAFSVWLEQGFYQGVCGGALGFIGFALTIQRLGAVSASLFIALVPPLATLFALPLLGVMPTYLEAGSILFATFGIVISLFPKKV
jgi:drug/metabolite transporter (DMT)-like permease